MYGWVGYLLVLRTQLRIAFLCDCDLCFVSLVYIHLKSIGRIYMQCSLQRVQYRVYEVCNEKFDSRAKEYDKCREEQEH